MEGLPQPLKALETQQIQQRFLDSEHGSESQESQSLALPGQQRQDGTWRDARKEDWLV